MNYKKPDFIFSKIFKNEILPIRFASKRVILQAKKRSVVVIEILVVLRVMETIRKASAEE